MSDEQQQQSNEISIEDLELSLEVYEIESDQKLQKLKELFQEKKSLDLRQTFYEERSSLEVKFQSIIGDLTEFLITQEVPSTEKLRRTFYRILESPLLLLFKISRFQIFNLRLNAFDIELQPIEAICELATLLNKNIEEYTANQKHFKSDQTNSEYESYEQFLQHAKVNLIADEIFILYSYLRKGSNILKEKLQDKVKIIQIFNNIETKLISTLLKNEDSKTLKELSILNYEIYLLENSFDVLCFFLRIPLKEVYKDCFKELENLAHKSKTTCNFDMFIYIFVKYSSQILAKVQSEGVEPYYYSYIENCLTTLLDLWGCRVCQYKEFFQLFKTLFYIDSDQKALLEICLKHTPNLSKDDIALLRANIRQHIESRHSQLLSLMKKQTLENIESELNALYHQILYNLDFGKESKEKIVELLTLINGNSSIEQFFSTVQNAFREWNYTIDFKNQHKFIETEFQIPKLKKFQILESLRLFTNICVLEQKGFNKEYEELVGKGTLNKALIGLVRFLLSNKESLEHLKEESIASEFLIAAFRFLQKTLPSNSQEWESVIGSISEGIRLFPENLKINLQNEVSEFMISNSDNFHLSKILHIFNTIFNSMQNNQERKDQLTKVLIEFLMSDANQKSQEIKKFRFIGNSPQEIASQGQGLTQSESEFLTKYCCIENGLINVKDTGCFKLSDLEVITNPIQFEKALDNYYLTLDSNSKRFIQFVCEKWAVASSKQLESPQQQYYSELVSKLITLYPICIPILSNVRVSVSPQGKEQIRFAEMIIDQLSNKKQCATVKEIIQNLIECRQIKYRNGKDYVVEELVPMILKRLLTRVNQLTLKDRLTVEVYEILALLLKNSKLHDTKADTIQKSIEKINFQIRHSKSEKDICRLSEASHIIFELFFKKKELDIKRKNLASTYKQVVWNEIRTFSLSAASTANSANNSSPKVLSQPPKISEHIMVSPFTLNQEYNLEEYKVKKNEQKVKSNHKEEASIPVDKVIAQITKKQDGLRSISAPTMDRNISLKEVDLSKMKYDIAYHLGKDAVQRLQVKDNISIQQKFSAENSSQGPSEESNEKNITFVQYYLREMSYPEVSEEVTLKTILSYLKKQIKISYIWSNPNNLRKIFGSLMILFDHATNKENTSSVADLPESWKEIIQCLNTDKIGCVKQIINTYSDIGYHNLWGENYQTLTSDTNIMKSLNIKTFENQCFLALFLRKSLDFPQLPDIKEELNNFLRLLFVSRPIEQTTLMYKVGIDKNLLNLIMKSLEIENLKNVSFLFHSNFNNLRLYTDQLHEGLKALNMSSKIRSYNEYIQLAKEIEDEEFQGPMKLFQQNFDFFIKIEKEGYNFKRNEEKKLAFERLINVLRRFDSVSKDKISAECDEIIEQYLNEIEQLQLSIANRVKSFYLVTKLRDLSYQNSITISLVSQILEQKDMAHEAILKQISKVDIFSLLLKMHKQLVLFDNDWNDMSRYTSYKIVDQKTIQKDISLCTTRRYSHSMSKVYEKCDLELDEVIQRCIDQLKMFLQTGLGKQYIQGQQDWFNPAILVKSFLSQSSSADQLIQEIRRALESSCVNKTTLNVEMKTKANFIADGVAQLRKLDKSNFYFRDRVVFILEGKVFKPEQFVAVIAAHMMHNETLVPSKSKQSQYLTFNRYKSSEATLEEIEFLGYLVSYCLYHRFPLLNRDSSEIIPLQSCILAAISFGIAQMDDLLDIDFKIWEDIKKVLSIEDSKTLNLNFSYLFENINTLKQERVELIDKGTSKKVNNLNREQFCDAVTCHVLYNTIQKQIFRFMEAILTICPKQLLSSATFKDIFQIFYNGEKVKSNVSKYMKKIGIVKPQIAFVKGQKIENLKDFQNIQWAEEILFENPQLKQKLWQEETNLCILTTIGSKGNLQWNRDNLLIEHFTNKKQMEVALKSLKL